MIFETDLSTIKGVIRKLTAFSEDVNVRISLREKDIIFEVFNRKSASAIEIKLGGASITEDVVDSSVIPYRNLRNAIESINKNNEVVTIAVQSDKVFVKSGSSSVAILPVDDDLGAVQRIDPVCTFEVAPAIFSKVLADCIPYTSDDNSHYALQGVKIDEIDGELCAVATNGRCLNVEPLQATYEELSLPNDVILPTRFCQIFRSLANDVIQDAKVLISNEAFAVEWDGLYVRVQRVEGRYPNWKKMFPKESDCKVIEFDREEIANAIQSASHVNDNKFKTVRFVFDGEKVTLKTNTEQCMWEEKIELFDGEIEGEVAFDVSYLRWFCSANGDKLVWFISDLKKAAYMKIGESRFLIMPIELLKAEEKE